MISLSMNQAANEYHDATDHYIYLYRDGEVVFYVGRSLSPLDRLDEHLGVSGRLGVPDAIGQLIQDHAPTSLDWIVDLYTLQDCIPIVREQYPGSARWYEEQQQLAIPELLLYRDRLIVIAENASIAKWRPCMNRTNNPHGQRLPDRYVIHKIANEGIKLSDD